MLLIVLAIVLVLPVYIIRSLPVAPFLIIPAFLIAAIGSFYSIGFGGEKTNVKRLVVCLSISATLFIAGLAANAADQTFFSLFN